MDEPRQPTFVKRGVLTSRTQDVLEMKIMVDPVLWEEGLGRDLPAYLLYRFKREFEKELDGSDREIDYFEIRLHAVLKEREDGLDIDDYVNDEES